MTLVEVIGVLAVLAIFAAVLLPALIRETDKVVADKETANLQAFGNALQQNIMRNGYISGAADWLTNVATELGMFVSDVAANTRNQPRFFLIDPGLQVGTNGYGILPYTQSPAGSPPPASTRVMILSSLGVAFPAGMKNGVLATPGDFSNIWNTADGVVPSGVTALSGWKGTGDDLKIQRVNLSPLFIHLVLTSYASTNASYYSINGTLNPTALTSANWLDRYFLQNSVLGLYSASTAALDSQQILTSDSSFVYYQNAWRGTLTASGAGSSTNLAMGFDFTSIVNGFLAAPASPGGPAQQLVVGDFIAYLNAYTAWAGSNFTDSGLYNAAMAAYNTMNTDVTALENSFP
jgi:type II secretory pathway pseudopilin PulG